MKLFLSIVFVIVLVERDVEAAPKPFLSSLVNKGADIIKNRVEKGSEAIGKVMNVGNKVTDLTTKVAGKASFMGTSIGKVGLSSLTTFGDQALNEGVGVLGKGLDFLKDTTGSIPILGSQIKTGADVGKLGLDLTHSATRNVLDLVNNIGLGGLTAVNSAAQMTTGSVGGAASAGFGLGTKTAKSGANAITSAVDKGIGSLTSFFG